MAMATFLLLRCSGTVWYSQNIDDPRDERKKDGLCANNLKARSKRRSVKCHHKREGAD